MKFHFRKPLAYVLSLMMLLSLSAPYMSVAAAGEEEENASEAAAETKETSEEKTAAEKKDEKSDEKAEEETEEKAFDYIKESYASPEEKLASMQLYYENDEYAISGDEISGEVGILVKSSGQIMLTNPYDVAKSKATDSIKEQLMSQIILSYSDNSGTIVSLNSYADAAFASEETKQITMTPTRKGLRVEYTIGREAVKYIVPRQIEKSAFENDILGYFDDHSREYKKLKAYYVLKDPNEPGLSSTTIDAMQTKWPITKTYAIYVLDTAIGNREMLELEGYIKNNTYYDEYSKVEDMYEKLNYVDTSAAPALFRFAIEYNLDDLGLEIKLPGSSIRYDSSNYKLESVKFLPYFCAGNNTNTGFTLVPDGSGAITRFEDIGTKQFTLTGRLYGRDYSFHSISGTTQETMRLPAFGVVENKPLTAKTTKTETTKVEPEVTEDAEAAEGEAVDETDNADAAEGEEVTEEAETTEEAEAAEETEATEEAEVSEETEATEEAEESEEVPAAETAKPEEKAEDNTMSFGYAAYLIEGDAMAEITAEHGGTVHQYSSVYTTFYPKPSDSYELKGVSSTGSANFTVRSDRRYVGNYTLRVFPLSGEEPGEKIDYNDMAEAVRNYLVENGTFTKMTAENDTSGDVPLYIETFGTVKTKQKFIGFPVNVQMPLTTFDHVKTMIDELQGEGVGNLNFRLTGWYNGGLEHTAPAKIKVEKKIGGEKGLKDLAVYAKEKNVGLYPDIEFVYVDTVGSFDGFAYKKDSVKTIDDRSAAFRKYSPLYQGFEEKGSLIISPTSMIKFYDKIKNKFGTFGVSGISVASLGSELSSDHNEDYTLNREDVKTIVSRLMADMKKDNGSLMVNGGNAYTLPYADHILGVSLDSSLNINTSESVPFVGMVLHGNVNFTGSAINLDGDFEYSMLKAIENGADLYFILSYQKTPELKQFEDFSKYYAIGYENWKTAAVNDIVSTYTRFNDSMKQVKYSYIVDHETVDTRVVRVKYENDVEFILNYNTHPIEYDGVTVEALDYVQM